MSNELQAGENITNESAIKVLNRFKCNYCKRVLDIERKESFPCSSCGRGSMVKIKSKTFCSKCGKPIYDNVTPPDKLTIFPGGSKDYVDVICADCTRATVSGVQKTEEKLRTNFKDAEDIEEKKVYYNAKMKDAERLGISPDKVKIKSLGERLRIVRKKLKWNQNQLAEYLGLKSKSAVVRYENNERKIPEDTKEWIRGVESMFHRYGREKTVEKVSDFQKACKSPQEKLPRSAELMSGA
jgi:DNA-binding XRE family transcriptional regulator